MKPLCCFLQRLHVLKWECVCMCLCRPGTRRLRETCRWPRSVQTRPSGTTSWQPAGTSSFHFWPSSCSSSFSSTSAHPRAPSTSSERMASKTSWNCSAGRWSRRERNFLKKSRLQQIRTDIMVPKKFCQSKVRDQDKSLILNGNQVLKSAQHQNNPNWQERKVNLCLCVIRVSSLGCTGIRYYAIKSLKQGIQMIYTQR